MPASKKIKATLEHNAAERQWRIVAHDRSGLEATGLKAKHATAALLGKLISKYQCEIELETKMVLPEDLQRELDDLTRDTAIAEKLANEIPMRRHRLARQLYTMSFGQVEIAERLGLSQSYIAQYLRMEPEEAAAIVSAPRKKPA